MNVMPGIDALGGFAPVHKVGMRITDGSSVATRKRQFSSLYFHTLNTELSYTNETARVKFTYKKVHLLELKFDKYQ